MTGVVAGDWTQCEWLLKGKRKDLNKLVWYEQGYVWAGYIYDNKGKQLIFEKLAWLG